MPWMSHLVQPLNRKVLSRKEEWCYLQTDITQRYPLAPLSGRFARLPGRTISLSLPPSVRKEQIDLAGQHKLLTSTARLPATAADRGPGGRVTSWAGSELDLFTSDDPRVAREGHCKSEKTKKLYGGAVLSDESVRSSPMWDNFMTAQILARTSDQNHSRQPRQNPARWRNLRLKTKLMFTED
ncbi:hypothetical protein RRG08_011865 [Elysia crispata]|uniref:Uncharacterized protein n=1 Tax=Elysia crispata TaxID=231223 RepID=A0AAE0ZMM1_9GAST|nr:hypothetical protein RRG08_011865 [Elysia crispata]